MDAEAAQQQQLKSTSADGQSQGEAQAVALTKRGERDSSAILSLLYKI